MSFAGQMRCMYNTWYFECRVLLVVSVPFVFLVLMLQFG